MFPDEIRESKLPIGFLLDSCYKSASSNDWASLPSAESRFRYVFSKLGLKESASILDFGCGTGDLLQWLSVNYTSPFKYTGVEVRKQTLIIAQNRFSQLTFASFREKLEDDGSYFDYIVMFGTIGYSVLENSKLDEEYYINLISELYYKLMIGGSLVFTVRRRGHEKSADYKNMVTMDINLIKTIENLGALLTIDTGMREHEFCVFMSRVS
jgi:cyclopropane fatty-acyl-phospholipid synthase-like methyltransferase